MMVISQALGALLASTDPLVNARRIQTPSGCRAAFVFVSPERSEFPEHAL